jgi:predicted transcriptional regulator YdeE
MEYRTEYIDNFEIVGISVRTTNKNLQSDKDIGSLWQRFTENNMAARIPNKISYDIYCVYTDYESDHTGFYTAILGCKVSEPGIIPEGFVGVTIASGTYQVYTPKGKFPENIANTWKQIWQADIKRKYTTDYDLYKAGANSFEETQAEIYLAV